MTKDEEQRLARAIYGDVQVIKIYTLDTYMWEEEGSAVVVSEWDVQGFFKLFISDMCYSSAVTVELVNATAHIYKFRYGHATVEYFQISNL